YQHRRLMLTLEESGLMDMGFRAQPPRDDRSNSVAFDMPLTDYIYVYVVGCCLSVVGFFAELLFARRPQRQQVRRAT
ncbi:hypothetical protein MTO96_044642, partial [Rhipicephalus appendiculatus]